MDYLVILIAFVAIIIILRLMKSAFKFVLTVGIMLFIIYFLDIQGIIDISPFLDQLGL